MRIARSLGSGEARHDPPNRPSRMEFVYVVPRARLFPDHYPTGLVVLGAQEERALGELIRRHGFFVERDHAEGNPDLKQVIPYSVVVVDGEILLLRRLRRGGEARLHDKLSIGVGGHINPEDLELAGVPGAGEERDPVRAGTRREVSEELGIEGTYDVRTVGLLNDDTNPVGAVHVGVVQVLTVRGSVTIRERDVLEGRLVPPEELREMLSAGANFETWSSILVESLDEFLLESLPVIT